MMINDTSVAEREKDILSLSLNWMCYFLGYIRISESNKS